MPSLPTCRLLRSSKVEEELPACAARQMPYVSIDASSLSSLVDHNISFFSHGALPPPPDSGTAAPHWTLVAVLAAAAAGAFAAVGRMLARRHHMARQPPPHDADRERLLGRGGQPAGSAHTSGGSRRSSSAAGAEPEVSRSAGLVCLTRRRRLASLVDSHLAPGGRGTSVEMVPLQSGLPHRLGSTGRQERGGGGMPAVPEGGEAPPHALQRLLSERSTAGSTAASRQWALSTASLRLQPSELEVRGPAGPTRLAEVCTR